MDKFCFTPFPVLETKRLLLKQITLADTASLFDLRSDSVVMKYLDRPRPSSSEEIVQMIQKMEEAATEGQGISWGLFLKENPAQLVGTLGYYRTTPEHFRAEIGYLLAANLHRKGLMQEALEVVISYGFNSMKLHSIEANTNPSNLASQRLLEKFGFVREAYFRENYFFDGKFLDSAIYSLIKGDHKDVS
jgi:ribosomal-protein-alanine N-acetyltransferase